MEKPENNIADYIAKQPKDIQKLLNKIRLTIKKEAPEAVGCIKYGMPTFVLKGTNLIHFASFKKHIGIYPSPSLIVKFKKELALYQTSKGAIQFPLDKTLPLDLVTKIVKWRVKEVSQKTKS